MPTLRHFTSEEAVITYIASEIVETLEEDYRKMQQEERQHYTNEDRREMRQRLADVKTMAERLPSMFDALTTIAAWNPERSPNEKGGLSIIDAIDTAQAALGMAGRKGQPS